MALGAQGTETEPWESAGCWGRQASRESAKTRRGILFSVHKEGGSDAWALSTSLSTSPLGYGLLSECGLIQGVPCPSNARPPGLGTAGSLSWSRPHTPVSAGAPTPCPGMTSHPSTPQGPHLSRSARKSCLDRCSQSKFVWFIFSFSTGARASGPGA